MNVLVIGDVHGCYNTFAKLVNEHWNPENEFLVQVGDLISKGPHTAKCVRFVKKLQKKYPFQVFILKGNHEDRYLKYHDKPFKSQSVDRSKRDFMRLDMNLKKVNTWLQNLPFKWETPYMLITHAGISESVKNPYSYTNPRGVIHNRSSLRNIGKVQVFGHMVQGNGKVDYSELANAWCIDTGAWLGKNLSALRLSYEGKILETIQIKTLPEDLD